MESSADQITLICALGNPGEKYDQTRHNAGFWFLSKLAENEGFGFTESNRFKARLGDYRQDGQIIRTVAPQTFMNRSGEVLAPIAKFYKLRPAQILVVHDEIDLLPGSIKFKTGGGHGGHNGLRDIVKHLGSNDFHRLRVGVGHPGDRTKVVSYVLNRPSDAEKQLVDVSIEFAIGVLPLILKGQFSAVMNVLHSS